jgi:pimeloyl-ACP methyl ester carboxylesterase
LSDYVLVHGAWHGGWCWDRVRPLLEPAGHRVWTPTLTGVGDAVARATPDVGLETHIADLVRLLEDMDLRGVVVVAHSYAGVPVTALADRCRDRIAAVVYLDSGMPRDGENANDVFPGTDEAYAADVASRGDGWLIPVPAAETFGIADEGDLAWVRARLTPHPLKTFTDRVRLRTSPPAVPSGAIVCALDGTADSPAARSLGDMPTITVQAGHDVMITDPELVVDAVGEVLRRLH